MSASAQNMEFQPLLGALKQIQFWLESERPPQIMLAAQTMEEFKSQKLPPHCKVSRRRIRGPRVPVHGRRKVKELINTVAQWPNDALVEGIFPTLVFIMSGEADIRLVDYVVHCRAGDILFIPARLPKLDGSRPHYEKMSPDAHCDILMLQLGVNNALISATVCHSKGDTHEPGSKEESCWIKNNLLANLFAGFGDELQNVGHTKSTFYLLAAFVLLFQQELLQSRAYVSLNFPSDSPALHTHAPIQQATEYMQNHLERSLSIDLVARWVGLSRAVFTKRFREETNESFKTYLTRLRLEQAKVLLCETNLPIERVSERVGLTPGQLRNLFHENHLCTPTEFRHSSKKSHN
jgi:AraC-like DNA-binding protein